MNSKLFQDRLATGSLTLFVAGLISAIFWLLLPAYEPLSTDTLPNYLPAFLNGIYIRSLCGYALLLLSGILLWGFTVHHALIRVHSTFYLSFFLMVSACMLPHTLNTGNVLACCLTASFFFLFHTYQGIEPTGTIFQGFLFYGIATLLFPSLMLLFPFLFIMQTWFHRPTPRTFFAMLTGTLLPYWFLLGYAFWNETPEVFTHPFITMVQFTPIDYTHIGLAGGINLTILVGLNLGCIILYTGNSYLDKIRTRTCMHYILAMATLLLLFILLQPQHYTTLLAPLVLCCSLPMGQYLAVTRTRKSLIFGIIVLILMSFLYIFNLWTQHSNFF